ncbi:cytochrome c biogenesis protein ResB [Georgenia subflava]|uniref:Cytochrome c biogenesis protein ResB n=1 Tax=Georgenia subflava TaxID=1622177 RepID=A0A6N7EMY0_9MICO|nr:cytochrome c biogenesis protein ResB [Georgenia subflava]MPV37885.1 cytochrome c biogenesis protein ResB [Georgenia subflava]
MNTTTEVDATNLSSKAGQGQRGAAEPPRGTRLGLVGWLRWMWRQLTSMRVAIMLLLLLAVTALPGSLFPQQPQDPARVDEYFTTYPRLAPWLERLGFFDVYNSPWFAAVYLLLFTSLIGCIVPRVRVHWRALRAQPPRVPRSFQRFPVRQERTVTESRPRVQASIMSALKGRYRAAVTTDGITAERGYLRETGNLVFHLSLIGVLLSLAAGQFYSHRGQFIVVEGESFANSILDYDTFDPGTFFDPGTLEPFTFTLEEFDSEFTIDAMARDFAATVTVREPGGTTRQEVIKVNDPMSAGGANVYLMGNGFAPRITVRDGAGEVAFSEPVPFLPEDSVYTSKGVIKVPDVSVGEQLGLTGAFLPTAVVAPDGSGAYSVHPQPNAPLMVLTLWAGDLGLDGGVPQNIYVLDTDDMRQVYEEAEDGSPGSVDGGQQPVTLFLAPGETIELPEELGTVTFESLPRFVGLDLRYDPSLPYLLGSSIAAMLGLFASLFVPRRRLWVKLADTPDGGTVITGAALARGDDPGLARDLARVLRDAGTLTSPAPELQDSAGTAIEPTAPTPAGDNPARKDTDA